MKTGNIISLIAAGIAMCVSIRSCSVANDANKIAKESLEQTDIQFYKANRPYLLIVPQKFKDSNECIKTESTENELKFQLRLNITNGGNAVAENIRIPDTMLTNMGAQKRYSISNDAKFLSLGAGDSFSCIQVFTQAYENSSSVSKNTSILKSHGINISFPIEYVNGLNPLIKYRTTVEFTIFFDKAYIKNSKFEVIENK